MPMVMTEGREIGLKTVTHHNTCLACYLRLFDGEHAAFKNGGQDRYILEPYRLNCKGVLRQNREVGDFSGGDTAQIVFLPPSIRGVNRHGPQGIFNPDALLRPGYPAGWRHPVNAAPDEEQRITGSHRQVGMKGKRYVAL